ncbi:MAG: PLP-dependent aminotransferase family protein [SAR202 cluster bacterium]|nr:PLP-dependent aminotransferase family protein [SAR202 cluster bacterium]
MAKGSFDFSTKVAKNVPPIPSGGRPAQGRVRYDFTTAFMDPETFPTEGLVEGLKKGLSKEGKELVFYPSNLGHTGMRQYIADKLAKERGMKVSPEQIVLTTGSGQAVARFAELLLNPGDTVLAEQFTYNGTMQIMRRHGAKIKGVSMDKEGLIPEALDEALTDLESKKTPAKMIYAIPTFQNPTARTMGLKRRKEVLAVSQKHSTPLFEDDCYADNWFYEPPPPAIQSMDQEGNVLYCGSFSKIVAPGMRLGYMVAPPQVIEYVKGIHLGATPSQFSVLATLNFLQEHGKEHIELCRGVFRKKKDVAYASVREYMGNRVECDDTKGGLYLWVKMPEGTNTAKLLAKAREQGLSYSIGTNFSAEQDAYNYLRLCFAHLNNEDIREGIRRIARFFEQEGVLK